MVGILDYLIYMMVSRLLALSPLLVIIGFGLVSYGLWKLFKQLGMISKRLWTNRKQFL
ncbi:hypothetical protein ScFU1_15110 [Streptococcus canis]|nr:hypothetical protein ScFU1_15110 [Streptococcus canis]